MSVSPSLLSSLASLPTGPGVYIFAGRDAEIIYIGKAKNLKKRVSSYFRSNHGLLPVTRRLVGSVKSLDYIPVSGEIEALLLESRLIKKYRPFYNLISKDDKSPYYIGLSPDRFPFPVINHEARKSLAGPFINRRIPAEILKYFRRITPYCQTAGKAQKPCLYSHIGLCFPCPSPISAFFPDKATSYRKNISSLKKLISGNFKAVSRELMINMREAANRRDFETAVLLRDRLHLLTSISAVKITPDEYLVNPNLLADQNQLKVTALLTVLSPYFHFANPPPSAFRIEMYDIASISGHSATGAMTVSIGGDISSSRFRHFTIKSSSGRDDIACLLEILTRRLNRSDWPYPDLIVLDGGKSQLSIRESLIINHEPLPPMISLAKRQETIIIPTTSGFVEINLPKNNSGLQHLQFLRDEAHRFSRRLHLKYRQKKLWGVLK